jgi:hypothetical protein
MTKKRKAGEKVSRHKRWATFAKRAAIMLVVIFVAAGLLAAVGWESVSALGIVKEAAQALADAAADAFGDSA